MTENTRAEEVVKWEMPNITLGRESRFPSQSEVSKIENDARKKGFDAGYQEGKAAAAEELKKTQAALLELINGRAFPIAQIDQAVKNTLLELVQEIATQLLRKTYTENTELIQRVIEETLRLLLPTEKCMVFVSTEDFALIQASIGDLQEKLKDTSSFVHVVQDIKLQAGDVRVETEQSAIHADIPARIKQLLFDDTPKVE